MVAPPLLMKEHQGAHQIELCSALSEGGLTPSYGLVKVLSTMLSIPMYVMIRPRGGDFLYSAEEKQVVNLIECCC